MTTSERDSRHDVQSLTADECVGIKVNELLFLNRATRRQLAEVLGVSAATAGRKVRGEIAWSLSDLYAAADFFSVDVTELLPRRVPWRILGVVATPADQDASSKALIR